MFCIHCGNQLPDNALFCSKCGKPTQNNISKGGGVTTAPQSNSSPYELCEFLLERNQGFMGIGAGFTITIVVTGLNGRKIVRSEIVYDGFKSGDKKAQELVDAFANEYAQNGWQALPSKKEWGVILPRFQR